MAWIRQNLERLGDSALDQAITLPWVQETLRQAVTDTTKQSPPYLLGGIDFAFFESPTRFLLRIGELGHGATHVRLSLEGTRVEDHRHHPLGRLDQLAVVRHQELAAWAMPGHVAGGSQRQADGVGQGGSDAGQRPRLTAPPR